MNKDSFPCRYDTSSAGHIQAGDEPLESAVRELSEELGIQANPDDLRFAVPFPPALLMFALNSPSAAYILP